eukprot:5174147-Prymnesium_polylepis.1
MLCDGSQPLNASCFGMPYYEAEMRALARAALGGGMRLWRHADGVGPVAPVSGPALAKLPASSSIDVVWLMHEIANFGPSAAAWREHRSPLELALLRARALYGHAPAVIMMTK